MARPSPSVILEVDAELLEELDRRLGPPIDSYLMGWQVWLVDAEVAGSRRGRGGRAQPATVTVELRLHPPASFRPPEGVSHHDLWEVVLAGIARARAEGRPPEPLDIGGRPHRVTDLWELLEVYPAYRTRITPVQLARWVEQTLGRAPVGAGWVDHDRLGGLFRRRGHAADIPGQLRRALTPAARPGS